MDVIDDLCNLFKSSKSEEQALILGCTNVLVESRKEGLVTRDEIEKMLTPIVHGCYDNEAKVKTLVELTSPLYEMLGKRKWSKYIA